MSFIKDLLNSISGSKPDSLFVSVDKKGIMKDFVINKKGESPNQTLAAFIDKQLSISNDEGFVPDNAILKYDLRNLYIPFSYKDQGKYFAEGILSYLHKENILPELSIPLRDVAFAVRKGIDLNKLDDLSVLSCGLLEKYEDYGHFLYKQKQLSALYQDDLYFIVETSPENSFIITQNGNGRKELKNICKTSPTVFSSIRTCRTVLKYLRCDMMNIPVQLSRMRRDFQRNIAWFLTRKRFLSL